MDGILHGECFGLTRAELITNATGVAAGYFEVGVDRIRVRLANETIEHIERTMNDKTVAIRFAADFQAEVIL